MDRANHNEVWRSLGNVCIAVLLALVAAGASGQERAGVRALKDIAYVP